MEIEATSNNRRWFVWTGMLSSLSKHKEISPHWIEFDLWLFHKCMKYILITLAPNLCKLSHYPHFLLFSPIYDIHVFLISHTHWVQPGLSVGLWVWICLCTRNRNTPWIHNWKQWQHLLQNPLMGIHHGGVGAQVETPPCFTIDCWQPHALGCI